jgi:hypothetical protein
MLASPSGFAGAGNTRAKAATSRRTPNSRFPQQILAGLKNPMLPRTAYITQKFTISKQQREKKNEEIFRNYGGSGRADDR